MIHKCLGPLLGNSRGKINTFASLEYPSSSHFPSYTSESWGSRSLKSVLHYSYNYYLLFALPFLIRCLTFTFDIILKKIFKDEKLKVFYRLPFIWCSSFLCHTCDQGLPTWCWTSQKAKQIHLRRKTKPLVGNSSLAVLDSSSFGPSFILSWIFFSSSFDRCPLEQN